MSYYFDNMVKPCLLDRYKIKVVSQPEFIILVNTALAGSASDTMQLPIRGTDMIIDWGDGFIQTGVTQTATPSSSNWITRVYASSGIYEIKIIGLNYIYFNDIGDKLKLLEIKNWGQSNWLTFNRSFRGCLNMNGTYQDKPNLSQVTDLTSMFAFTTFNHTVNDWDISNVTSLNTLFFNNNVFNKPINNWDTSKVLNFFACFRVASAFNQDIGSWNTENAETMWDMFREASIFNQNISAWDTSKVANMNNMFLQASLFNQDLSGWCVPLISSLPANFDILATSWTLPNSRPIWGTCP